MQVADAATDLLACSILIQLPGMAVAPRNALGSIASRTCNDLNAAPWCSGDSVISSGIISTKLSMYVMYLYVRMCI